jgi:hypothetical protein
MISPEQCRDESATCLNLGQQQADFSVRRATLLMTMSRTWNTLANQLERYDMIKKEEDRAAN